MTTSTFDCAFFGYKDLPELIELNEYKLVPIKSLKVRYTGNSMYSSTDLFSVSTIKDICEALGIKLHRPVKGLYCIEEKFCKFFDYLYRNPNVIPDNTKLYLSHLIPIYHEFAS